LNIVESVGYLPKLKYFLLSSNELKSLPYSIGIGSDYFDKFYVDRNNLSYLPSNLRKIALMDHFDVNRNPLDKEPLEYQIDEEDEEKK
jgi:Leucine-rich repeat (LRR) protein